MRHRRWRQHADQPGGARCGTAQRARSCWCSTTFPRSSPPSVPRRGARWPAFGARNQEPADPHPAVGRAPGDQARRASCLPAEQAVLAKSVKTIVDQVDAMKRLVNEFRDYARLPAAELQPLDLNALVADVLHLYGAENAQVPVKPSWTRAAPHRRRCPAAAPGGAQPAAKRPGRHHAGGRAEGN